MVSFDFNRQLALVTGASRGIGKAIVKSLLDSNALVVGTYFHDDMVADQCRHDLNVYGNRFVLIKSDVASRAEVQKLLSLAVSHFKKNISLLVNNAGVLRQGDFFELSDAQWDTTFASNLKGPFILCQELLKQQKKTPFMLAAIVNISSIGGQIGGDKAPDYAASKAALISFTRSMARLGAKFNLRTNAVAPGWIQTDIFSDTQLENLKTEAKKAIPLGRMGSPDEVAMTVLYLLSDASSYITGHCININGGMYFG